MIHGNVGRKRPDLAERNRKGLSSATRNKISKSRKGLNIVYRPNNPCPRCNSIHVISVGSSWKCGNCGKTWTKNCKKMNKIMRPDNPCPRCDSIYVNSYGKDWRCSDCHKTWRKNPKPLGWRVKNLPEAKISVSKEELSRLYWDKKLCQMEIAEKLGISQSRVSQLMNEYGISNRGRAEGVNRRTRNQQNKINKKISKALKGNTNWRFSHEFPNKEEQKLIIFFKKWNLNFKYVGDGSFKIDGKCPDFVNKDKKRLIEFFGELWHEGSDEPSRIQFFKERGWDCLVVWGKEVGWWAKTRGHRVTYKWERSLYDKIIRWMAGLD